MQKEKKKPLQVYLTEDEKKFVQLEANKKGIAQTEYLRGLVNNQKKRR